MNERKRIQNYLLTIEQLAALRKYAKANGRTWKSRLLTEWERGTVTGELQQVRNTFGPSWLIKFSFNKYPAV